MNNLSLVEDQFDEDDMVWLRCLYTIVLIFFCTNFALSIFNIIKYVYPMKERSKLIMLFYGLIIISNVCYITIYIHLNIAPSKTDPFQLRVNGNMGVYDLLEMIGSLGMLALGWLVTAIMFQLTLSIRVIFSLDTKEDALKKMKWMSIYASVWTAL